MVNSEKAKLALKAVQALLLHGRQISSATADEQNEVFNILDSAEYIVALLMEPGDSTKAICEYLATSLEETPIPEAEAAMTELKEKHQQETGDHIWKTGPQSFD